VRRFFKDEGFDFAFTLVLGSVYHKLADVGECLAAAEQIDDGNFESWHWAWEGAGVRVRGFAEAAEAGGHRVSAREAYLRASSYFDAATYFLDGTDDPERLLPTWERHRDCWDRAVALFDPPVEKAAIPYEDASLEGYVFRVDGNGTQRPLLVMNNGSDGPVSSMWALGGAGGVARGYNVLTFDGPGQGAALLRQGLPFRHDWEEVIGPVVDFALTLPEVDPARIALLGVSQAGYWVPRALAFERRIAAGVADPGVFDVKTSWLDKTPRSLLKRLERGDHEKFDRDMRMGERFSRSARATLEFRMRPYGRKSPYEVYRALEAYNLEGIAERIECPMLVTDPENESFWPGQSQRLYDALRCPKAIVRFDADEGADLHCEPRALALRDQRIFDWLDETLGR
jgi:hypothetical protein